MPFTISPGVLSREIDLTTVVPTIATTRGGFAGPFLWGPVGDPQNGTVQNDTQLQETFWRKNEATAVSYLSASNFLKYGGTLEISRVVGAGAMNASTANTTYGATVAGSTVAINNYKSYTLSYDEYSGGTPTSTYGPFVAKYPGARGNSLRISISGSGWPAIGINPGKSKYLCQGPSPHCLVTTISLLLSNSKLKFESLISS